MSDPAAEVRLTQELEELKRAHTRVLRQLGKAKASQEELVAAVYDAARDSIAGMTLKPVTRPPRPQRPKGGEEWAVAVLSDLQLGMVTPTYNSDVAEERLHRYADKIVDLTDLQRSSRPVPNCKLYMLGDLVEGELIFPNQPHQIDSSLYAQTVETGPRLISDFIRRLLSHFEKVEVVSVPGNHGDVGGASRRQYNPETNADRMLSRIVQWIMEAAGEDRVSFRIPKGYGRSSFYAVDYVGDVGFMLWHGHQARRTSSSSHLPFYKLVMGWRSGAVPEPFHVSICGHHHTPTMLYMNDVVHFINGSFEDSNEYAQERLAATSRAAQWLLFAKPDKGVTAQYLVYLDD